MNRYWRTVRHLAPGQVLARIGLRARAGLARCAPQLAAAAAARRSSPVPDLAPGPTVDPVLLGPCSDCVSEETANEVAEGRFRFLGVTRDLGDDPFPAPADAPLLWAYHLEYMEYLVDLCRSGRVDRAARLMRSRWVSEGIPRRSARHPYPESRRLVSWLRVLPWLDAADRGLAAEGAWRWAGRVAANLERDVGGNHLLENGLALALAGVTFRGRRAADFRRTARSILVAGVREQVLEDGAHYELSPMYHARVLAVLLEGGRALSATGTEFPPDYWETLGRMAAFLSAVIDPRGRLPLLGDSAREAGFDPTRFLAGVRQALPVPVSKVPPGDVHLAGCGLARFEDRAEGHRLLLDAGPVCPDRLPAHGQADTFGFELHVGGEPFVVDAGLYEYASGPMRDWCRSTRAHSTVTVDGQDSSEMWASFRVGQRARVRDLEWTTVDGRGMLSARHDGYRHLGVSHVRCIAHLAPGVWLVADSLRGARPHVYASRLHLHPEVAREAEGRAIRLRLGAETLRVMPFGADSFEVDQGWHCPAFGDRRESRLLRLDVAGSQASFGYVLAAGEGPAPEVRLDGAGVRVAVDGASWWRRLP